MFFDKSGKNATFEANNKFKFFVDFQFQESVAASSPDYTNGKNWLLESYHIELEKSLRVFAKSINAPSINVEFERAYANEYVHYFQNGSIHWEAITIKFVDFSKTAPEGNYQILRQVLDQYLQYNLLEYDYNNGPKLQSPLTFDNLNRTRVIDMPRFCNLITISSFPSSPKQDYPTSTALKDLKNGKSFNDLYVQYSNIMQESFRIYNPIVTKVDFGAFDYNSDEINELTMTLVPEWCSFDRNDNNTNLQTRDTFGTGISNIE